jgi:transposase-like protein
MVAAIAREIEDRIIEDYREEGVPVRVIGERYGVTRESVFNVLRRREVPRRRRPGGKRKEFTADELARIGELRRQQWSVEELADEFHTGNERVIRALDNLGLPRRMRRRDAADRRVTNQGYVYVHIGRDDSMRSMAGPRGYVLEHRLVMARALGRPLKSSPEETVHHINGQRDDNRLENLQLRIGQHGKGVVMTCANCGSNDITALTLAS